MTTDTDTNRTAETDLPRFHDAIAGALYHAIALRRLARYRDALDDAKTYHVDTSALPNAPNYEELSAAYEALADEFLPEEPDSVGAIDAILNLAIAIVTDRQGALMFREGLFVTEEKDFMPLTMALGALSRWINKLGLEEFVAQARARRAGRESR